MSKTRKMDPLFQMFEHSLANKSYEDSAAFTKQLAQQYVSYLDSTLAHLPFHVRQSVLEDLETEAHEMLVKKMYGVVKASDYANRGQVMRLEKGDELQPFDFLPTGPGEQTPKPK